MKNFIKNFLFLGLLISLATNLKSQTKTFRAKNEPVQVSASTFNQLIIDKAGADTVYPYTTPFVKNYNWHTLLLTGAGSTESYAAPSIVNSYIGDMFTISATGTTGATIIFIPSSRWQYSANQTFTLGALGSLVVTLRFDGTKWVTLFVTNN